MTETGDSRDISSFSLQEVDNARARDCASKLCTFVWLIDVSALTVRVGKQILWDDRRKDYKKDHTHTHTNRLD